MKKKLFYFLLQNLQKVKGNSVDCLQDSSQFECKDFKLEEYKIMQNYLNPLCEKMPLMPGCKIKELCDKNDFISKPACHPFSLWADICDKDMPRMNDCLDYTKLCKNESSKVAQCKHYPPLQSLPTTNEVRDLVGSICSEMDMIGCDECRGHRCDYFASYTILCQQMPRMKQCSSFNSMCRWNPFLTFCLANSNDQVDLPPQMKMFFHFGYRDYILFESWVPNGFFSYLIACIFCFLCALGYEYLIFLKARFERRIQKQQYASHILANSPSDETSSFGSIGRIEDPLIGSKSLPATLTRIYRGLMRCATISGAYILMLLIMSYNVGLFLSVVVGLGVGSALWGQVIYDSSSSQIEEHCS